MAPATIPQFNKALVDVIFVVDNNTGAEHPPDAADVVKLAFGANSEQSALTVHT